MKLTINKIIESQTIDEFTLEQQEKICEKYNDYLVQDNWFDFIIDDFIETMPKYFGNVKIYFSGFYSQGDGACFDADINVNELINAIPSKLLHGKTKNAITNYNNICGVDFSCKIKRVGSYNLYSHENTRAFEFSIYSNSDNKKFITKLENIESEIESYFEAERLKICKDLYKTLEKEYNFLTSFEALKASFEVGNYFFNSETLDIDYQ